MAEFSAYSGVTTAQPPLTTGIHRWFQFDAAGNTYVTDSSHLIIDTPNFPTLNNGYATNGNLCGSGITQGGENTKDRGPSHYVNIDSTGAGATSPPFGFSATGLWAHMGGVNWSTYSTTANGKTANNFPVDVGGGAKQFDGVSGAPNQSIHPGNLTRGVISIILPSQYDLGGSPLAAGRDENCRRIHYTCAEGVGNLAIALAKIWAGNIGKMSGGALGIGGGINAGMANEEAASIWLSNGYGLVFNGAPHFASL